MNFKKHSTFTLFFVAEYNNYTKKDIARRVLGFEESFEIWAFRMNSEETRTKWSVLFFQKIPSNSLTFSQFFSKSTNFRRELFQKVATLYYLFV